MRGAQRLDRWLPCAAFAALVALAGACSADDDDAALTVDAAARDAGRDAAASDARAPVADAAAPADSAAQLDAASDRDGGDASLPVVGEDFVDFGALQPSARGALQLELDVPADAISLVVTADPGPVPRTVALLELRGPGDELLYDGTADAPQPFDPASAQNVSDPLPYSWMLPSSPELALEPGRYRVALYVSEGPAGSAERAPVRVDVVFARGAADELRALPIVLWSVAGAALDARAAQADADLQAALAVLAELYAAADLPLAPPAYRDLGPGDGELALLDDDAELAQLLALLAERAGAERALDIVLVDELAPQPGKTVLAKVSGIPGPPAHPALARRGAVILPLAALPADPERAGALLAHESAHYLGLRHTSEYDGLRHDPIADTPECPTERATHVSSAGEPLLSAEDCADLDGANLLFYTPPQGDLVQATLTDGQREVLARNPLFH